MQTLRFRLRFLVAFFGMVMLLGTVGFMWAEGISFADAIYFSIVTIATVGYGDIHPSTPVGKIIAVFVIIMGVGTFLGVVANATEIMLMRRESATRCEKMNMVIGLFYSEVGTRFLVICSDHDPNLAALRDEFVITSEWTDEEFKALRQRLSTYTYGIDMSTCDLREIRALLVEKKDFLVRLLENPILLEHEFFTNLLRAVFHLAEELAVREDMDALPESDLVHLRGDIDRAYHRTVLQWLDYMEYLKGNYPYLFSLALRTNPFDRKATPVVR